MLKPSNDNYKPPLRPYKVLTVSSRKVGGGKFIKRHIVIATSANNAVESLALHENEVVVEAKELLDYDLVIAK